MRISILLVAAMLVSTPALAQTYHGPIIDAHAHIRTGDSDAIRPDQPKGVAQLRALDAQAKIGRSALIVIGVGNPEDVRAKNDAVLAAAEADLKHFFAIPSVNPDNGDAALVELDRLATRGARIIKLHPSSQEFDVASPIVSRIAARAGALDLTLLFDSFDPLDPSQVGKFVKLTMSQPNTKFILAHMTFHRFRETITFAMLGKMGAARNVWFDLSAIVPNYADSPVEAELVWTMRKVGMDRMIFGSDWPVYTPAESVAAVRRLGLTVKEQKLVFNDNVAKLLDRGGNKP